MLERTRNSLDDYRQSLAAQQANAEELAQVISFDIGFLGGMLGRDGDVPAAGDVFDPFASLEYWWNNQLEQTIWDP
jgi:hypothetical protein